MKNPFLILSRKEKILWAVSLIIVALANILSGSFDYLTFFTALIGVTAVLFQAKGNIWGQIFITIFAVLYGIISLQFHYYGEMMTYLGMALPMALWAIYTWMRHPSESDPHAVKIRRLKPMHYVILVISGAAVTYVFYLILARFNTPNLVFSTISITTSFYAAALTMLRSTFYAFWYAMNDLVLIVLWVYASTKDPSYIPMVINFAVFFLNDLYGFYSWKKREKVQRMDGQT